MAPRAVLFIQLLATCIVLFNTGHLATGETRSVQQRLGTGLEYVPDAKELGLAFVEGPRKLWGIFGSKEEAQQQTAENARVAILSIVIAPQSNHFVTDQKQLGWGYVLDNFANKYRYAHFHGYDFIPVFWNFHDPDLPGAWAKIPAIHQYLRRYDWIWCTDIDLFITNRALSLEEHLLKDVPPDKSVVVARDCNNLNTGSLLIRNTAPAFRFLEAVYAQRRNTSLFEYEHWYEQSAIIHVYDNDIDGLRSQFHIVAQQLFNSYFKPHNRPGSHACGHGWEFNDFAVHFPGYSNKTGAWMELLQEGGEELLGLLP